FVVFFLPVPVSRVRETGLVQVQPMYVAQVPVEIPGRLVKLHVTEGQFVRKGQLLAEFASQELDAAYLRASSEADLRQKGVENYARQIAEEPDPDRKSRLRQEHSKAETELRKARSQ